jgi:hypothetical protein
MRPCRTIHASSAARCSGIRAPSVGGNLFTGLHQEDVIVRLAEKDRLAAIDKRGARLFEPMAGRPMREYIVLPQSALVDRGALAAWLQRGLSYAASLPPKARKPVRKAKSTTAVTRDGSVLEHAPGATRDENVPASTSPELPVGRSTGPRKGAPSRPGT